MRIVLPSIPIILFFLLFSPTNFTLQDLTIYRQAGIALTTGENPYNLPQMRHYGTIGWGGFDEMTLQIWTPPFALFIPLLLSILPLAGAKFLWAFSCCAVVVLSASIYRRLSSSDEVFAPLFATWGLCSAFWVNGLTWGSIAPFQSIPFFILVLLLSSSPSSPRVIRVGLTLFFTSFKPQLTVAQLGKYTMAAIHNRSLLKTIVVGASCSLSCLLLCLLLRPTLFYDYLTIDKRPFLERAHSNVSLPKILNAQPWVSSTNFTALLLVFVVIFTLWHRATRNLTTERQIIEFTPLSFLIMPYCWGHHFILLLPWLTLLVGDYVKESIPWRRASFLIGFFFWSAGQLILVSGDSGYAFFWSKYPLFAGLLVWLFLRFNQLRQQTKL